MNQITKVSEITYRNVADYIRLSEVTASDQNLLNTLLGIAKNYILKYTGIEESDMDNYPDFVIVVFVLCQDMYDNRTLYVDKGSLNVVIETILGMHSVNLLPSGDGND